MVLSVVKPLNIASFTEIFQDNHWKIPRPLNFFQLNSQFWLQTRKLIIIIPFSSRSRTKSTASWFVITFHIPSQARIINSSSSVTLWYFISKIHRPWNLYYWWDELPGKAVIIWSFSSNFELSLYIWSPNALDKFSPPFTRPSSKYKCYSFKVLGSTDR